MSDKKNIMLIAHFCDYGTENSNNRFNYLANLLTEAGHHVQLITSSFSHRDKTQRVKSEARTAPYTITLIDEPSYSKNVSLKRLFYSHKTMAKNLKKYLSTASTPDVVYCAVPSLDVAYVTAQYAKENGIKFIIDVQDLWPEAFQMVIPIPMVGKLLFAPWKRKADKIYSTADEIVAVSQTYADRALMVNSKCDKTHVVYLGTDLDVFDTAAAEKPAFEKENGKCYLGYCGTLGASYDIPCVLNALESLKSRGVDAHKFIVLGDGPQKAALEAMAQEKELDVLFTGRMPYDKMCACLAACDMLVNPIVKGAAQSIINKHADYAASGKAALNTQECVEYRNLVDSYSFGINCPVGDAEKLADAMEYLYTHEEERLQMGANARHMAEKLFDRKNSYREILKVVQE